MNKITDQDLANRGVIGLPDVPGLTTEEMQRKLEEIAREILVPKVNEIIENIETLNSNLSFPKAIEVDDLNNAIPTEDGRIGFYRFSNIASNSPQTGYFGFAITYRISNLYCTQIAFTNDPANILYKRSTSEGTWNEWVSNQ